MEYKNEFTRERLEVLILTADRTRRNLARSLLAEMDKPKVWDGAPEWATSAHVSWSIKMPSTHYDEMKSASTQYTRKLPKSRAREIAELVASESKARRYEELPDIIESAILKREAELKEGKE